MKKKIIITFCAFPLFGLISCGGNSVTELATIVFTNDIHSYIDNVDKEGNLALRLSQVGAYVDDLKLQGKNTLLLDAGDSIQGNVYGGYDKGSSVIDIMNKTGYDISIPGNHDFDYNVQTFVELTKKASFDVLSCNFVSLPSKEKVFSSTKVFTFNNVKIGVVGISTPETLTTSTPTFFQDDKGNWIYDFLGSSDYKQLYNATQEAVDSIKDKVDFVIAVGHLGVEPITITNHLSSIDVINNTNGIDLFIDGHSHTLIEGDKHKNKDNKDVMLVQTGEHLAKFGAVTIKSDRSLSLKMEDGYSKIQKSTSEAENTLIKTIDTLLGQQVANNKTKLHINNPDKDKQRLIRAREMNIGDFVADSFYWYLNDQKELGCDVAIQNGGGIRTFINEGSVTYRNLKDVEPFNNTTCLIEATGQEIKDALEMGITICDQWDEKWDCPAENGGFLQVAGLTYTVDCSIPSHVVTDEKGMFIKVDGDYRAKDIKIYNRETSKYDDIDLTKTYKLGGINYLLRNSGNGLSMFRDNKPIVDNLDTDFQVLVNYVSSFTKQGDYPLIATENSPLVKKANYSINYENAYGANRINIINLPD